MNVPLFMKIAFFSVGNSLEWKFVFYNKIAYNMDYIIQYIHKKTNKHHSSFQELDSFSVFFKILQLIIITRRKRCRLILLTLNCKHFASKAN